MQPFDVQSIAISAPVDAVFRYVADRFALPDWTQHAAQPFGGSRVAPVIF
jgi:hypothetical protein